MGTGTATTVSCQGDDGAGTDIIAFGDESLGEVAIADGEVALPTLMTSPCIMAYVGS